MRMSEDVEIEMVKEKREGHDKELFNRAMKNRKFRMMIYNNRFGKKLKMSV